jgi:hypothetical protein
MRAGEVADVVVLARRRPAPAPTIRALAALVLLVVALLVVTGASDRGRAGRRVRRPSPNATTVLGARITRDTPPDASTITVAPDTSTSTTTARPAPTSPSAARVASVAAATVTTSCADALAYLATHQAPGFVDTCGDGSAQGHLGYTCADTPGRCEKQRFIRIACPAPFVYMNEAHNSWVLIGARSGIDPFGQGSAAEQAACAVHR